MCRSKFSVDEIEPETRLPGMTVSYTGSQRQSEPAHFVNWLLPESMDNSAGILEFHYSVRAVEEH